jgi:hypothetical protein
MAGRRNRIVISCVTFETIKITEPIKYYQATRAHLIHYIKEPDTEKGKVYAEFFERVCELIEDDCPDIIEHKASVSDFSAMLKTVFAIIQCENNCPDPSDIYINISAGSSEYVAAATIASMMLPGTIPFSVPTKDYMVEENVRNIFFENKKPVGLTKTIWEPKPIPKYTISVPERHLVDGLKILLEMERRNHYPKGSEMIPILKSRGIWYRGETVECQTADEDKVKRIDSVYYQRDFVSIWLDNGWIKKDKLKKRYVLTDEGRSVVETFYVENIDSNIVQKGHKNF